MALIPLLFGVALVGLIVYLIVTFIPMPESFKTVIVAIAAIAVIVWLMQQLGVAGPTLRLP